MGDPAGIGGEILIKAWAARQGLPAFFAIDDPTRLRAEAGRLGVDLPLVEIGDPREAEAICGSALPILPIGLAAPAVPGRGDPANGAAVIRSIEMAVDCALRGEAAGIVTNPIHKETLYAAGFAFPGHTEKLEAMAGTSEAAVMMLACPELRVVPATIHVALAQAIRLVDRGLIVRTARVVDAALKVDFGIARPRIAVAGLNPHAGEGGAMGREDMDIVAPAVAELVRVGIDARGPLSADTMFHAAARRTYDAALCLYHDQALIPIKTIDFAGGVNVTLGLKIVRTSPDHGTAFDIAGKGVADPTSLIAAMRLAGEIAGRRAAGRS
jgi:4-hydroxythreonine-4-phosphate dehydrogenase